MSKRFKYFIAICAAAVLLMQAAGFAVLVWQSSSAANDRRNEFLRSIGTNVELRAELHSEDGMKYRYGVWQGHWGHDWDYRSDERIEFWHRRYSTDLTAVFPDGTELEWETETLW